MKTSLLKYIPVISIALVCFVVTTPLVLAQEFVELVGIPYVEDINAQGKGLGGYANSLYLAAISIAAILAVLRIVIAGVKYTLTDIVTTKGQAKKDIQNALLGLLVVVGAFLILYTINPKLINLDVLKLEDITGQLGEYGSRTPRTEVDQCPPNNRYIINENYPDGACITRNSDVLNGEDYTDSPEEGRAACGNTLVYNPETNTCDDVTEIHKVPTYILQGYALDTGVDLNSNNNDEDNISFFILRANEYCKGIEQEFVFDYDNRSCVNFNAL